MLLLNILNWQFR